MRNYEFVSIQIDGEGDCKGSRSSGTNSRTTSQRPVCTALHCIVPRCLPAYNRCEFNLDALQDDVTSEQCL
jgi:hypothetical protein